jgi:DNA-binding NarL/FixJ family response regulator
MSQLRTIRIVLVDDHHMFRTGVRAELTTAASPGGSGSGYGRQGAAYTLEIAGEAGAVESATEVIKETKPDVVLLDVHIPGGDGHGGADVIRACAGVQTEAGQPVRFLALSVSDAAEDVIAVIRAGARGYVTKTINADELLNAIGRVADGDAVFSPRLAGFVLDAFGAAAGEVAEIDEELDRLSAREREVMRLIARGYQYKEVAKELFISVKTVETHVSSVLRKLQLSSRHELTAWAMGRRIL